VATQNPTGTGGFLKKVQTMMSTMISRQLSCVLLLAASLGLVQSASADTTINNGQTVDSTDPAGWSDGAGTVTMYDNSTLQFHNTSQNHNPPGNVLSPGFQFNNAFIFAGNAGNINLRLNDNDTYLNFNGPMTSTATGPQILTITTGYSGNGDREAFNFNTGLTDGIGFGSTLGLDISYRTQSGSNSYVNLNAVNSFTGPITLSLVGADVQTGILVIGGERYERAFDSTLYNFPGSGSLNNGNYPGAITLNANGSQKTRLDYFSSATQTLSGPISGGGDVLMEGSGTLILSNAANNNSGNTTVTKGLLQPTVSGALSTNTNVVVSGGTLDATLAGQTVNTFAISGGQLNLTKGTDFTVSGAATFNGGTFNLSGFSLGDKVMTYGSAAGSKTILVSPALPYGQGLVYNTTELDIGNLPNVWLTAVSGNWSDSPKWSTAPASGSAGTVVTIGAPITNASNKTITVDETTTLGSLVLGSGADATHGYVLSGPNTMTFNNSGGGATITVEQGAHALSLPVALSDTLTVNTQVSSASLAISGNISGTGGLTSTGSGLLTLSGSNNYGGATAVNGGTVAITGGELTSAGYFVLGNASGNNGTLAMSGGSVNMTATGQRVDIGASGTGTMILSGTSSFTTAATEVNLCQSGGGVGTLTLMNSATFTQANSPSSLGIYVQRIGSGAGILNIQDSAVLNTNRLTIGLQGPGTVNQTGGTVNVTLGTAGNNFRLAGSAGASAVYNISAGALNISGMDMRLGYADKGTLNISGAGLVSMPGNAVVMGYSGGSGTLNLSGGTLLTAAVSRGSGTGTVLFNGGTLEPGGSTTTFLQGLTAAKVQAGGAKINTNGKNITIAQNLVEDTSSTGGGLNKSGAGALTLTGANTYTGATTVNSGTLLLAAASTNNIPNSSAINIAAGATLDVTGLTGSTLLDPQSLGATGAGTAFLNGSLSAAAGNTINMQDGTISTLNISGGLTVNGGTLKLDVGSSADQVTVTGAASLSSVHVNVASISGITAGTYPILTAASGVSNANFTLDTASVTGAGPSSQWAAAVPGNWGDGTKWTNNTPPNSAGLGAIINSATTAPVTITLDTPVTIGSLLLGNSGSASTGYTISGDSVNFLTLHNVLYSYGLSLSDNAPLDTVEQLTVAPGVATATTVAATITVASGTHEIQSPVSLVGGVTVSGSGALTVSGSISGTGPLTMSGAGGTLVLNASNGYSGGTFINAGTVQLTAASALPLNSALTLGTASSSGTLDVGAQSPTVSGVTFNGNPSLGSNIVATSGGQLNLASGANITVNGGKNTISAPVRFAGAATINTAAGTSLTWSNNVTTSQTSGDLNIVKNGLGTLNITGGSMFSLAGGSLPNQILNVQQGVLNVTGATLNLSSLITQSNLNAYINATNSNINIDDSINGWYHGGLRVGWGNGNYAYAMSGGSLWLNDNANDILIQENGNTGRTIMSLDGGAKVHTGGIEMGEGDYSAGHLTVRDATIDNSYLVRVGTSKGFGVVNQLGGTINQTNTTDGSHGWNTVGDLGDVNLDYRMNQPNCGGIYNLSGGTLTARGIHSGDGSANFAVNNAYFNFHGGTLSPSTSSLNDTYHNGFVYSTLTGSNSGHVSAPQLMVYSEGAVLDVASGHDITINEPFQAPPGQGVSGGTIILSGTNQGSGYKGAPNITVSTGYTGNGINNTNDATAIANMVDDGSGNGTFKIASITITNPGLSFSITPTAVAYGGDPTTPATLPALTLANNVSGGLTKNGMGTLTLGATSTYTGATTVNGGVLKAGTIGAIPTLSDIYVGTNSTAGELDLSGYPQTIKSITIGANGALDLSATNLITSSGAASFDYNGSLYVSGVTGAQTLMYYSGHTGTFNPANVHGLSGYTLAYNPGELDIVLAMIDATWASNSTSSWNTPGNWQTAVPGNDPARLGADTATFGGGLATVEAIHLDTTVPVNLKSLVFSASSYSLSGGSLTLQSTTGTASVTVSAGTQTIESSTVLTLASSTDMDIAAAAELKIGANIGESGGIRSLTKLGLGTLVLSGTNNYSGGTVVNAGILAITSSSALPDGQSLTVGAGGTLIFDPSFSGSSIQAASPVAMSAVAPVPEPGTLALLIAGLVVGWGAWRRKGLRG